MRKWGKRILVLTLISIFWFTSIQPYPVLAAEAFSEWNYQRKLLEIPVSSNQSETGFLDWITDSIKGLFRDDDVDKKPNKNSNLTTFANQTPKGKDRSKAKRVKELVNERRSNAKLYQLSDGRIEAEISSTPVHYQDPKGKWQDIKNTITISKEEKSYGYVNKTNYFQTYFGDQSSNSLVKVKSGKHELDMGLVEDKLISKQPTVQENQITYSDLYPNAKVEYETLDDSVKESIILDKVPSSNIFKFKLTLDGLTAKPQKDGSISIVNEKEARTVFAIPKPFMFDSKKNPRSPYGKEWSPKVTQTIVQKGNEAELTIQADFDWLKDPKRQYPVVIDPTIVIQPPPRGSGVLSQDTMISSDQPNSNFHYSWNLAVGSDLSKITRALVKFDLSTIKPGTPIDAARVDLYYDQQFCNGCSDNQVDFSLHRMTQNWDPTTVTWNQAEAGVAWNTSNTANAGAFRSSLEYNMETVNDRDSSTKAYANGNWGPLRSVPDTYAYNGNYYVSPAGDGTSTFTWIPNLTESGKYELQLYYPGEAGYATNAPFTVYHKGGPTTLSVDQTTNGGKWSPQGTFLFDAGNTHKVVLSNQANASVLADAIRLVKYSVATKPKGIDNQVHSFSARSLVQDWINGTQPNYGVMIKALDETKKLGGVNYTASSHENYGVDDNQIRPKLVITFGQKGVSLNQPTKLHSNGAELSWNQYTGEDFVEYQVHRSSEQNFIPDESTLVAPVEQLGQLSYIDTTAPEVPFMQKVANENLTRVNPDPQYYYMVVVKTSSGELIPSETRFVRLPTAGLSRQIIQPSRDTTLSQSQPTTNLDKINNNNWLLAGNHSSTYGTTRSVLHFDTPDLSGLKITRARLGLWSWLTESTGGTPAYYCVHALNSDFTESTTWSTAGGTNGGGNFNATHIDQYQANLVPRPHWTFWDTTSIVQSWAKGTSVNRGLIVKKGYETSTDKEMTYFLSSEASATSLRPQLEITYTTESSEKIYHAPSTPSVMLPGKEYEVYVTLTNTTDQTWYGATDRLSYHWYNASGQEVSTTDNQIMTTFRPVDENGIELPDPIDIKPNEGIKVRAKVKAPILSGNSLRQEFSLRWDIKRPDEWLSRQAVSPVATLNQKVFVEKDENDKSFGSSAAHVKEKVGPNSIVGVNLYKGNLTYNFTPFQNPIKGFSVYASLTYNSLNEQETLMSKGWSLDTNSMMSIGAPMTNAATINLKTDKIVSGSVILVDDEGSSHTFTADAATPNTGKFVAPKGTNLSLKYLSGTNKLKKWVVIESNQTSYYFDEKGYVTEVVDRNGNKLTFTYEERKINNKPTKLLKYMTDSANRRVLSLTYNANNKLQYIDDLVGRRTSLTYDTEGRLVKIVDGIDKNNITTVAEKVRTYQFVYHATKKHMIEKVIDPKGNITSVEYNSTGTEANRIGQLINREGKITHFRYNSNEAVVIDPLYRESRFLFDGRGRNISFTNAMNQTTRYEYDDDDNLIKTEEPIRTGETAPAITTTTYDPYNHGLPVTKMDAVNNALPDLTARKSTKYEYSYSADFTSAKLVKETTPEGKTISYLYDNKGNLISKKDIYGNETKYTYYIKDSTGKVINTTDPDAAGTNTGLLKTVTDPNGNITTYGDPAAADLGYDPNGKPKKIRNPLGYVTTFEYGPRGEVLSTTDAKGKKSTFTYDIYGNLDIAKSPKDQLMGEYIITYGPELDENGNVLTQYSPNGAFTKFEYDKMDRVVKTILPKDTSTSVERVKTYEYNPVGKLVKETEPNGNLTLENPDDFATKYEYNALDQITAIVNAKGDRIEQEYDNVGNLIKITQPEGVKTVCASGVTTCNPHDYSVRKVYDLNHRLIKEIDANGNYTQLTYNADGQVTISRDKEGNLKYNYYDGRGLLIESRYHHDTDAIRITKYRYDKIGNLTETETPRGTETAAPGDYTLKKSYDRLNRVSEAFFSNDPNSLNPRYKELHSIKYKYDPVGNIIQVSTPPTEGSTTRNTATFSYFDNGWIKQIEDPWKTKTTYQYDKLGQETERLVQSADATLQRGMTWDYYPDGKLKKSYDAGLRSPSLPPFQFKHLEYFYDANGNLIETKDKSTGVEFDTYRMTYTALNQVYTIEDIVNGVVKHKQEINYDDNGNVFSQEDPLNRSMFYYNDMNQVDEIASKEASATDYLWTTFAYTPNGQLSKVTKPNNISTAYSYYLDSLLKVMETKKQDGTTIQRHELEYNANGHRTKDTYTGIDADNKPINNIFTYEYDPRDRLVGYNKTGTSTSSEKYELDANSNIVSKIKDGVVTSYQYDKDRLISESTNGVTKQYEYDPIGRVSKITSGGVIQESFQYDVFDNLKEHQRLNQDKSAMIKTQYAYDALDRTISKTENALTTSAKTTKYNYLGTSGQVISEEVDNIITRSYTYSAWGERLSMTKKTAQGSETSYYLNNTDVDVEMLLDEQGNVRATYGYTPYGENDEALFTGVDKPDPANPNKEMYNPYRYSGKPWDPNSKSYDLGFRNYYPGVGRFLTADSYTDSEKYRGLLMDAENYNVYGFAGGNPVSNVDLDGHFSLGFAINIAKYAYKMHRMAYTFNPYYRLYSRASYYARTKARKNASKHRIQRPGKLSHERKEIDRIFSEMTLEEKQANRDILIGALGLFVAPEGIAAYGGAGIFTTWFGATRIGSTISKYGGAILGGAGAAASVVKKGWDDLTGWLSKNFGKADEAVGGSCFVAGTQIRTADGSKSIEDIKVGEKVLAKDEKTGKLDYKKVVTLFKREVDEKYEIYVSGEKIETTAEHPFWVEGKGWMKVKDLQEGDLLLTSTGKRLPIEKIVVKKQHIVVYNFEVEDYHTYFVSDLQIFVHNKSMKFDITKSNDAGLILDHALQRQGLDRAPKNFKEKWSQDGYTFEVRIHDADPRWGKTGSIVRIAKQKHGIKPGTTNQGYGWEYLDEFGEWHHTSTLKPQSPTYNADAARDTHIQWP